MSLQTLALASKIVEDPDEGYLRWRELLGTLPPKAYEAGAEGGGDAVQELSEILRAEPEYLQRRQWLKETAEALLRCKGKSKDQKMEFTLGPFADIDPQKIPVARYTEQAQQELAQKSIPGKNEQSKKQRFKHYKEIQKGNSQWSSPV